MHVCEDHKAKITEELDEFSKTAALRNVDLTQIRLPRAPSSKPVAARRVFWKWAVAASAAIMFLMVTVLFLAQGHKEMAPPPPDQVAESLPYRPSSHSDLLFVTLSLIVVCIVLFLLNLAIRAVQRIERR